mmetsp:Transcript_10216/g.16539  ORF Transcript_10216/g.16539 Transcript_10216/m.16539 type:complete len:690 (+) Transcript_10216:55-2124(+)
MLNRLHVTLRKGTVDELSSLLQELEKTTPSIDNYLPEKMREKVKLDETKTSNKRGIQEREVKQEGNIKTSDITLISHAHGRQRRQERGIRRKDLQAAIKHGRKEEANPGPKGQLRWKYTHRGVVFITDESSKNEITSWRLDDEDSMVFDGHFESCTGTYSSHTVIVVDHSGSMRRGDVPGYKSRTEAVYDCLITEFLKPQLELKVAQESEAVVSLIQMSKKAHVVLERTPLKDSLLGVLEKLKRTRARSHGNYIPALDKVLEVLSPDYHKPTRLYLVFLSDGAPSDHTFEECVDGVKVWQVEEWEASYHCDDVIACRRAVKKYVEDEVLKRVRKLGDYFGRDRMMIGTVAFGPPNLNYRMLKQMANELPRGSFQKLGLQVGGLKTALTSLTTSLTTLRTEGSSGLTDRNKKVDQKAKIDLAKSNGLFREDGWYCHHKCHRLELTDTRKTITKPREELGIAAYYTPFAGGVERYVYRSCRIKKESGVNIRKGPWLVCKEGRHEETFGTSKFQIKCLKIQIEAGKFAKTFNRRLGSKPSWIIRFLDCEVYHIDEPEYNNWVLLEPTLEGKFLKWNNNGGSVSKSILKYVDNISEEEEDIDELPQAFSHFSYCDSGGKKLVCDLQGTYNRYDGFLLTDPCIHYHSKSGKRHLHGATDKGLEGMKRFFHSHKCSKFCKLLGLEEPKFEDDYKG